MEYLLLCLIEDGIYQLTDVDGNLSGTATGKDLMQNGYNITVSQPRSSVLITFEKLSS